MSSTADDIAKLRTHIDERFEHVDSRFNLVIRSGIAVLLFVLAATGGLIFYLSAQQDRTTRLEERNGAVEARATENTADLNRLSAQIGDMRAILGRVEEQMAAQAAASIRIEKRLDKLIDNLER